MVSASSVSNNSTATATSTTGQRLAVEMTCLQENGPAAQIDSATVAPGTVEVYNGATSQCSFSVHVVKGPYAFTNPYKEGDSDCHVVFLRRGNSLDVMVCFEWVETMLDSVVTQGQARDQVDCWSLLQARGGVNTGDRLPDFYPAHEAGRVTYSEAAPGTRIHTKPCPGHPDLYNPNADERRDMIMEYALAYTGTGETQDGEVKDLKFGFYLIPGRCEMAIPEALQEATGLRSTPVSMRASRREDGFEIAIYFNPRLLFPGRGVDHAGVYCSAV